MPDYEYECQSCREEFTVHLSVDAHDEDDKQHRIACPKCGSTDTKHLIETIYVTTTKKS